MLLRLRLRCQHLKHLRREVRGRGRSREPVRIAAHIRCAKVLWRQGTSNRGHQCFSHRTPALSAAHQKLAEAYLGQVQRGQEPLGRLHPWGICSDVSRPVEQPMHCPHYKELAYIRLAPMTVHKRGSSWRSEERRVGKECRSGLTTADEEARKNRVALQITAAEWQ